jgi:TolB-like protein
MTSDTPETPRARPTVFLSYASEDRPAARLLGGTLPNYGLEVWYDESELGGGDAWDQKIRRQIRECDYFMPLISAHTEARHEGYFRREWRLAVERTLDMADDHLFLLPVVIDGTDEARARVPEKFLAVQWLRLPGGQTSPALEALCRRLVTGDSTAASAPRRGAPPPVLSSRAALAPAMPQFPQQVPGQRVRFWFAVAGWALRSAALQWRRLRPWLRVLILGWLVFLFVSRGCVTRHHETENVSPAAAARLKAISDQYQGGGNPGDAAKLAAQIAHEFAPTVPATPGAAPRVHILVIPFAPAAGDADAGKLADSALAQVYGRIAIRQGQHLAMATDPLPACDLAGILERGHVVHSEFMVCGTIETQPDGAALTVRIASGSEKAFMWSKSYPVQGSDPALIANEVDAKLAALEDE